MAPERISVERRAGVVCVTLAEPERRNPLTWQTASELVEALNEAVASGCRAAIVTGAGPGFCSGGDIASMSDGLGDGTGEGVLAYYEKVLTVAELPIPVVAAVNGAAVGAGLNLAMVCDLRLAARSARFGATFLRIGLPPGMGASWLLSRLVGPARAAELILLARTIDADEAERIGLVTRVVDDDVLMDEAWSTAEILASGPPLATSLTKEALRLAGRAAHDEVVRFEAAAQAKAARTDDFREGLAAFLEKRPPRFSGR